MRIKSPKYYEQTENLLGSLDVFFFGLSDPNRRTTYPLIARSGLEE